MKTYLTTGFDNRAIQSIQLRQKDVRNGKSGHVGRNISFQHVRKRLHAVFKSLILFYGMAFVE